MDDLAAKIEALPPELKQEVEDFVDFLRMKRMSGSDRTLRQDWAGALRDLKDEYTSVELQHKITEQWGKAALD